jgi:hypothetical protein
MRYTASLSEMKVYKPKMTVLNCKGKSPTCLEKYIKTRKNQPDICLYCIFWYKIEHKYKDILL